MMDGVENKKEANGSKVTTVCGFIKHYSSLSSEQAKEKYQQSHMVRKYCPVLMKRAMLEEMTKQSVAYDVNNVPYVDMQVSKINFVMALIALYTDQLVDRDEDDRPDSIKAYDELTKSRVIDAIMEEIGENEIQEMITIQDGYLQKFELENHSTEAILMQLVDRFGRLFGIGLGYVQEAVKGKSQKEILKMLKDMMGEMQE